MKFPHLFRCLICFLLIVALVGNAFFTPVNASAVAFSKVAIDSLIVVGSAIMGLGVLSGSDTNAYKSLASSVVSALGLGSVIDVVTWVASGGAYKYAIPQRIVEAIKTYLFGNSVVSRSSPTLGVALGPGGTITVSSSRSFTTTNYCEVFCSQAISGAKGRFLFFSHVPFSVNGTEATAYGTCYYVAFSGVPYAYWKDAGHYIFDYSPYGAYSHEGFANSCSSHYQGDTVSVSDGLVAGYIADETATIASGYAEWYANSVVVPGSVAGSSGDDDDEVYLPLAPGKTWGETTLGTQEDVWSGAGTWTDGESESGSGAGTGSVSSSISQTWLGQKLDSLVTSISGFFSNVISTIQAVPSAFSSWLDQIIELLRGLAGVISDALVEALSLVFALDAEYVQSEVDKMTSDFVFLGSMVDFGRGLVDVFYGIGSKPPVLYVDLDDAEGDIVWGDRVVFLDLTWYERYKPYGDAIISSFLWAWFGWRLLHNIPGLLNGTSGAVPSSSVFRSWGG